MKSPIEALDRKLLVLAESMVLTAARFGIDKRTLLREMASARLLCITVAIVLCVASDLWMMLTSVPALLLTARVDVNRWRYENQFAGRLDTASEIDAEMARCRAAMQLHLPLAVIMLSGEVLVMVIIASLVGLLISLGHFPSVLILLFLYLVPHSLYRYGQLIPPAPPRRRSASTTANAVPSAG